MSQSPKVQSALKRYRVMAWATGLLLIFNVVVALPYKYLFHGTNHWTAFAWVGHGYLYLIYVIVAFDLAVRVRWNFIRTILFLLAGTIPLASFFADRRARQLLGS